MKRFLIITFIFALVFCLVCCGSKNEESSSIESESLKQSQIKPIESKESFKESEQTFTSESVVESVLESLSEENSKASEGQQESLLESEKESEALSEEESQSKQESETESSLEVVYYTVTFDTDGGSYVASITVKEGETISKPSNPKKSSRDGEFEFVRWLYQGREWDFSNDVVTGNITLVAEWEVVAEYPPSILPED